MYRNFADCAMTTSGKVRDPHPVWETEESYGLCLVSKYWEAFADKLIALHRELGVTYFKWDAIGQYGCDSANHDHGNHENTETERRESYAFQLGAAMTKVVDKLCAACPEAIVDFDITEGHRTVGLQFLSSGKYFLINNGPYNHDYNMPVPSDGNVNLFFFPGPARAWICRAPLNFDKWIPSVLFLTHYLPDDNHKEGWGNKAEVTGQNPLIALASLVLGQNGVWGDLLSLSEETIATFARITDFYKQVRQDITQAYPVRTGEVGGSPEVHEKVHTETGRGAVCLFASGQGTYTYTTQNKVNANSWATNGVVLKSLASGQAHIRATFGPGEYAKIVFFGVEP
jgi:alpha-galactosidase